MDMTAAFNTIKRHTIINLLIDAGCSRDDMRLVQYLLSNTKLRVTVNKTQSGEFVINIGAYQGDSLAGKVFTLTLAGALKSKPHACSYISHHPKTYPSYI